MDSGANIFASYLRKYLHRFKCIKIGVDLAIGHAGSFDGYGIMLLSTPEAPNFLFACYPTFLAPRDTCCTVSNGAFLKYDGFTKVLLDTWCEAHFEHKSGAKFTLPLVPNNLIDYISFDVHTTMAVSRHAEQQQKLENNSLALQPVAINHPAVRGSWVQSWALHIHYGHRSLGTLQRMIDDGWISGPGIPKKLAPIPF